MSALILANMQYLVFEVSVNLESMLCYKMTAKFLSHNNFIALLSGWHYICMHTRFT